MNGHGGCVYLDKDFDVLSRTIAIFLTDGESVTFDGVDFDSLSYFKQDGVAYLRFKTSGRRAVVVPNVQYWTEG